MKESFIVSCSINTGNHYIKEDMDMKRADRFVGGVIFNFSSMKGTPRNILNVQSMLNVLILFVFCKQNDKSSQQERAL